MADPTPQVRAGVYTRDHHRCIACGTRMVTFGHRRAVGQGGSKTRPAAVDGVAQCLAHNEAAEHYDQVRALARGWKVRRWVQDPARVPMYYPHEGSWYRLVDDTRVAIADHEARWMMLEVYGEEWEAWDSETR